MTRKEYRQQIDAAPAKSAVLNRNLDASGKKTHKYVPIHYQEGMADYLFEYWDIIDTKVTFVERSDKVMTCTVIVTISYMPKYEGASERVTTGIASGFFASQKNSSEYGVPKIENQAIGNALQKIGNIFGRNIGRKVNVKGKVYEVPSDWSIRQQAEKEVESQKQGE